MSIRTKCKKYITAILPSYSIVPLLTMLAVNLVTYYGTRIITSGMEHHSMKMFLDDLIPFRTEFVYIYILAYVQWIAGYIMIGRESRNFCYRIITGEIIAKLLCLVLFVAYPTMIVRPEVTGTGFSDWLTALIYHADTADNLFPSIHCLESYICFRAAIGMNRKPRGYVLCMFLFSILVFASTVFLKQHVVADMFGAIAVAEIGLFLSGLLMKKRSSDHI